MLGHLNLGKLGYNSSSIDPIVLLEADALSTAIAIGLPIWYIKEDLSNAYANTLGTQPINLGLPVISRVDSPSVPSLQLLQSGSGTTRPVVASTNTNYYIMQFDGVNDKLISSYLDTEASASTFTIIISAVGTGNSKVAVGYSTGTVDTNKYIGANSTGNIGAGVAAATYDTLFAGINWSLPHVVTLQRNDTTLDMYVDGTLTNTQAVAGTWTPISLYLGALNSNGVATNFWQGNIGFMAAGSSAISESNRLILERFAAKKVGATYTL